MRLVATDINRLALGEMAVRVPLSANILVNIYHGWLLT